MEQVINPSRLKLARCRRQMTIKDLASKVGLTPRIMEWTHPLLTGLAMGHDEVVESHLERGWVHYEDYNHRFGY
ncbi:hypothetical protein, partial [Shewanella algae]|uniref:hypothetical protein n=1 Tax=Shewanella algae TaxID=38313 RepID=UPI001AAC61A9